MTDTAVANKTPIQPPIMVLRERLQTREAEIKAALPPDISFAQFVRATMTAASINPDILTCSWSSIWLALLRACRDGLLPDGVEGALVPFKGTATWIPMYQGLLRRFRRSGQFKWITAGIVRDGEDFRHYIDESGEHFHHTPGDNFSAPITKIYALATTKDGGIFVAVMPIAEANKIKGMSKTTRDDAPWRLWEEEMLKKTALRRLSKTLPSARDLMSDEDAPDAPAITVLPKPKDEHPQTGAQAADAEGGAEIGAEGRAPDSSADLLSTNAGRPDPIRTAYLRGVEWRKAGRFRKGLPVEYRSEERAAEAEAWHAGFDEKPMPDVEIGSET